MYEALLRTFINLTGYVASYTYGINPNGYCIISWFDGLIYRGESPVCFGLQHIETPMYDPFSIVFPGWNNSESRYVLIGYGNASVSGTGHMINATDVGARFLDMNIVQRMNILDSFIQEIVGIRIDNQRC